MTPGQAEACYIERRGWEACYREKRVGVVVKNSAS